MDINGQTKLADILAEYPFIAYYVFLGVAFRG